VCAFAIGAMSPDFEYLWRLTTEWHWSHSPLGLLYYCLPVSLLVLALWVGVVREPTRALLAVPIEKLPTSARWWFFSGLAILIGSATHIVWDGFTHGFGWAVHLAPVLRARISIGGLDVPVFTVLQHLSTVVGGVVVVAWLWSEVRSGTPRSLAMPWRIAVFTALGAVTAAVGVWNAARWRPASDYATLQMHATRATIGALLGLAVGLLTYGVVHRVIAAVSKEGSHPRRRLD
jgi:hypothetical protein